MCMMNGETFFSFMKKMWIGHLGASCYIMNNYSGLYDVADINKLVQGSSYGMHVTEQGKFCMKVWQVNGSKKYIMLCVVLCYGKC